MKEKRGSKRIIEGRQEEREHMERKKVGGREEVRKGNWNEGEERKVIYIYTCFESCSATRNHFKLNLARA
jgi:hypothetical protein